MRKITILILAIFVSGCATTLSPMQRRSIESKELEGDFDDAIKATLQVFQDHGYIIKSSDYQSGVIQGETGVKYGLLGVMTNFEITSTIEQFGENRIRQRLSLVKKVKTSSQHGTREDSKIIDDPEMFQKLYDEIQKEMFIRKNLSR